MNSFLGKKTPTGGANRKSAESFEANSDHSVEGARPSSDDVFFKAVDGFKELLLQNSSKQQKKLEALMKDAQAHREQIRLDMVGSPLRRNNTIRAR